MATGCFTLEVIVDYMIGLTQTAWAALWRCKWTGTPAGGGACYYCRDFGYFLAPWSRYRSVAGFLSWECWKLSMETLPPPPPRGFGGIFTLSHAGRATLVGMMLNSVQTSDVLCCLVIWPESSLSCRTEMSAFRPCNAEFLLCRDIRLQSMLQAVLSMFHSVQSIL